MALMLGLAVIPSAMAQNYGTWLGWSDEFKRGYVFALMGTLVGTCDTRSDPSCQWAKHYQNCLEGMTDGAAVLLVDQHVQRHPEIMKHAMTGVVLQAMNELCGNPRD